MQKPRAASGPESTPPVSGTAPAASAAYTLGYQTGTDFAAPAGTPVTAVTAGTVVESGASSAYGTNVQIRHDDGTYTLYAQLSGKTVGAGERVAIGGLIGYVGSTCTSSGPHLHLEGRTTPTLADGNFFDVVPWLRGPWGVGLTMIHIVGESLRKPVRNAYAATGPEAGR
ncbi:M23 family metallopeptidase [Streptomyces sp. NPDC014861]|uniref:M23 family metallopeptidase n=1 Tax=Streptomyces sp. NPDC014861 TaxID=3364923 RepID=UPI003702549E